MYPTVEVRWFYPGVIRPQVAGWFRQLTGDPAAQPPRVDLYLRLTAGDSLGIKLREGRIEVKQRQRQEEKFRFHPRVAGIVEHWRKWSFELARSGNELPSVATPASDWIAVKKTRQLRRYRLAAENSIETVPPESSPNQGCDLELTEIVAQEEAWWSLSFESFGEKSALRENLLLVVRYVLADEVPPLGARDSYGYPRWLAKSSYGARYGRIKK